MQKVKKDTVENIWSIMMRIQKMGVLYIKIYPACVQLAFWDKNLPFPNGRKSIWYLQHMKGPA